MDDVVPGRSVDIELGGQEVITIDLDNLDPDPNDVLDLLKEGNCKVWVWTKLAGEYWRRGYLEAAERIATTAIESKRSNGLHGIIFNASFQHLETTVQQLPSHQYILFWQISRSRTLGRHPS